MLRDSAEWTSIKRARYCVGCERQFTDGETYGSMLFAGDEGLAREDYCTACWDGAAQSKRSSAISHWLGRFKAEPVMKKEEPIARSMAERLLRKYMDAREPAQVNFRFILALMMERKKRLIPRDRVTEAGTGTIMVVYELADTGETFLIEDPKLQLSQAREVQKQVKELLDLEQAAAAPPPAPDATNDATVEGTVDATAHEGVR
ncbi:MAG: hypothetical protein NT045_07120 [Candidatus Aureabacteria bacterium]|nr:hypothetical protein [Candidatus Auribacterota bacterium]